MKKRMKKGLIFFVTAIAVSTWLGCASQSKKGSPARDAAGKLDAGIVGPNGEVVLFYKSGSKIVVQQCDDYTVLNKREDCKTKSGTTVAQVPVSEFKNRLKAALSVPGGYTPAMKKKIELYKKGKQDDIADLEAQRADVQRALKQITDFIAAYGSENADQTKMGRLQDQLAQIDAKLADNAELSGAIREINRLVDTLVDQIIGQPTLQKFVFSKDKQNFEFNILRSYVTTPGISAQFASIPAGTFTMGQAYQAALYNSDETPHSVTISKSFEIQTTEVTQAQWFLTMGYNPSRFKAKENCSSEYFESNGAGLCPNHPVESVSWNDAQAFIKKLNESQSDYTYRLPTEAEWEYAARGGDAGTYSFGNDVNYLRDHGWYYDEKKSENGSHAVGGLKANRYGLYDVHGNVWEFAQDYYGDYPKSAVTDPKGPSTGSYRVIRGGGWGNNAQGLRSAYRFYWYADFRDSDIGFRLVRTAR